MRKLLTVVLTLALLIGASLSTGYADDVRKFEGTVLHMIAEQQTPTVALMKQLDAFEDLTGIRVELEMGPFDNVVQKITLAMYSGSDMYDIIATPYQFLGNLVVNGYVQPLEPLMQNPDLRIIPGYNEDDIIAVWQASGSEDHLRDTGQLCIMRCLSPDLFDNPEEQAKFKGKYGYDWLTDWDTYRCCRVFHVLR